MKKKIFLGKSNDCNLNVYLYVKAILEENYPVQEWSASDPKGYMNCDVLIIVPGEKSLDSNNEFTLGRGIHDFVDNKWSGTTGPCSNVLFVHEITYDADKKPIIIVSPIDEIVKTGLDWKSYGMALKSDYNYRLDMIFNLPNRTGCPSDIINWTAKKTKSTSKSKLTLDFKLPKFQDHLLEELHSILSEVKPVSVSLDIYDEIDSEITRCNNQIHIEVSTPFDGISKEIDKKISEDKNNPFF
jgi:hypothetical protein